MRGFWVAGEPLPSPDPTPTPWLQLGKETLTPEWSPWRRRAGHGQATGTRLRSPVRKDTGFQSNGSDLGGLCWALEEGTRRLGTEKQVMQLQGDPQLELDTHLERQ